MALKNSALYKRLAKAAAKDRAVNRLLVCVDECFEDAINRTKSVIKHMPEYTLHDEVHLLRVVDIMSRLIPKRTMERLTPLELAGLMLSAAYHDIGMAPSDKEVRALLGTRKNSGGNDKRRYLELREEHPILLRRQQYLRKAGKNFEAQEIETWFLVAHLRRTHADRARKLLLHEYATKMIYDNYHFAGPLAEVCFSHNEDPDALRAIPAHQLVRGGGEYCNWRFVAIVLRLADILDFDPKRTPPILFEHLGIRDSVSVSEWKKHLAITGWDIQPERIAFAAQCRDPVIEKCIRDFVRMINNELLGSRAILAEMHDSGAPDLARQYALNLPFQVETKDIQAAVGPSGPLYIFTDLGFSLDQDRITDLLMGLNLYQTPILFLRELLQNAIDACRHRLALHERKPELGPYSPRVSVRLTRQSGEWYLEVEDNGMGMDEHIVRNFFARVGRSYYRSSDFFHERAHNSLDFAPVSQFGIGILSVFMVGDLLKVHTRRFSENAGPLSIEIANQGSLFWFNKGTRKVPGTSIRLRLLVDPATLWKDVRGEKGTLESTVGRLAPHTRIPIAISRPRAKEALITESWDVTNDERYCRGFTVKLDPKKTTGLEGILRVFILRSFETEVKVEDEEDEYGDDLSDYLIHRWGYIEHVYVDKSHKTQEIEHGYSTQVDSEGRWSQHGFSVRHPIFGRNNAPQIPFPFPVSYDLNILPPFAFPLTADRNGIVLSDEARQLCDRLAETIALAFFSVVGVAIVQGSEQFFREVARTDKDKSGAFLRALDKFLG